MSKILQWVKQFFRKKRNPSAALTLEEALLAADLGPSVVTELLTHKDKNKITEVLLQPFLAIESPVLQGNPAVVLMVGVNGVGKTTTTAKLAALFQREGKKVLLAAADTFRAAAIDQLKIWGERLHCEVVAQKPGADAAAVAFDAVSKGRAKNCDVVLIDTAGRQHTQSNLMEELKKVQRVTVKAMGGGAPQVWLVLDAQVGQNGLTQAKSFHEALGLTGVIITKLDGTAKGGILFSVVRTLKVPVLFLGNGESLTDFKRFDPKQFVDSLL